jgi:hypothetical protein
MKGGGVALLLQQLQQQQEEGKQQRRRRPTPSVPAPQKAARRRRRRRRRHRRRHAWLRRLRLRLPTIRRPCRRHRRVARFGRSFVRSQRGRRTRHGNTQLSCRPCKETEQQLLSSDDTGLPLQQKQHVPAAQHDQEGRADWRPLGSLSCWFVGLRVRGRALKKAAVERSRDGEREREQRPRLPQRGVGGATRHRNRQLGSQQASSSIVDVASFCLSMARRREDRCSCCCCSAFLQKRSC